MKQLTNRGIGIWSIVVSSMALGLLTETSHAQSTQQTSFWNQFRGPNGTGIAADANPPVKFDQKTNLRWATRLPAGHSSPVIWTDKIFITGIQNKTLETICLNSNTGKILWRNPAPPVEIEHHHPDNSPATSTAFVDANRVYVYFGSYGLLCYDHTGNEVWKRPVPTPANLHGTATSPVGYRSLLYLIHDSMEGDS